MKTKALIILAAFVVGSVASSMAARHSKNATAYINIRIPGIEVASPAKTFLANPLNLGDNHADKVLPLGDEAIGMLIFRFDPVTQNYREGITFIGSIGEPPNTNWVNVQDFKKAPYELFILNPGEAFMVQNMSTSLVITFVGEVPQGQLRKEVFGGAVVKNLISSIVPQELPLGDPTKPDTTLGFPAGEGDIAYAFDDKTQNWVEGSTYLPGVGWVSVETFEPVNNGDGPRIRVGTGFFVQKLTEGVHYWDRTFYID